MSKISVLMSGPDLKVVEGADRVSFCSGVAPEFWADGEGWLSSADEVGRVCAASGDCIVIQVIRPGGVPVEARAWRAVLACQDVFFKIGQDGQVVVVDHLRNMLPHLTPDERRISDDALLDHLLFRSIPGIQTYCAGVQRLGKGERVTVDLRTGKATRLLFDRLANIAEAAPAEHYLDSIDEALEHVLSPYRAANGVVCLLSGGIDSTLVQSYLGSGATALAGEAWNVSAYERDYPAQAARLLNVPLQTFQVAAEEYLPRLESAVDLIGQPPDLDQIVMMEKAYRQPGEIFLNGNVADCMLGMDGLRGPSAWVGRHLARVRAAPMLRLGARMSPGAARPQLTLMARSADRFSRPVLHARGYAGMACVFTDFSLMDRIFGPDQVSRRLEARLSYALERADLSAPESDPVARHLEAAHWTVQIMEHGTTMFRHLAHSSGKSMMCPFVMRPVMDSALRIPVRERYLKGIQSKYLLKRLLKRRVPAYPVDQRKGASLVHFERLFADGPLADFWDRYPVPDFLTGPEREEFLARPSLLTWSVALFAIWRDRVQRNLSTTYTDRMHRFDA